MEKELTHKEMSRRGGLATLKKYGMKYFIRLNELRWGKRKKKVKKKLST